MTWADDQALPAPGPGVVQKHAPALGAGRELMRRTAKPKKKLCVPQGPKEEKKEKKGPQADRNRNVPVAEGHLRPRPIYVEVEPKSR